MSIFTHLQRMSLLRKVLIANIFIILIGAVFGTALTAELARAPDSNRTLELIALFVIVGVPFSVGVNYVVLRAAFRPLQQLADTAMAVATGKRDARVPALISADPEIQRIGETLNDALTQVEHDSAEIRVMADRVIRAQEDERKRIARELHDDTSQVLFAHLLRASAWASSDNPDIRAAAVEMQAMLSEAMEALRRLGEDLRPPALDDLGLVEAMQSLIRRMSGVSGAEINLSVRGMRGRLDRSIELILYRVTQEALTNMWKHAQATQASVVLERQGDQVHLTITDDGTGFDPESDTPSRGRGTGVGLFGMRERCELVGGTLRLEARPGQGATIAAIIPVATAEKQDVDAP